ncbi:MULTISPECIES: hypothetical protein [Salinibaculum]
MSQSVPGRGPFVVPGMVPGATRRNIVVALVYAFFLVLAAGVLAMLM